MKFKIKPVIPDLKMLDISLEINPLSFLHSHHMSTYSIFVKFVILFVLLVV